VYKASIKVTLRPSILDPQGKATQHALESLGYASVQQVRIGRYIELFIAETDRDAAERVAKEACEKLLANPVMENYSIAIEEVKTNFAEHTS
jgi:phosphoribosylformylglycinamidine synthase subunit PurS